MRTTVRLIPMWSLAVAFCVSACPGRYDSAPQATQQETDAMRERYQALIDEAKALQPGQVDSLLHHFSQAVLTRTQPDRFARLVTVFANEARAGKLDKLEVIGGRAPGKVRLLLVSCELGKGAIPFVKGADGWKLDDIEAACGKYDKELDINGTTPASPPSSLAPLAVLLDPQSGFLDRIRAAIDLAAAGDRQAAQRFAADEKNPWPKAALLYAAWKSGGTCEPFARVFPIDGAEQHQLYDSDSDAYRTLLKGLFACATSSAQLAPSLKIYRGCQKVEGGPRSEYVDPLVELANAKPERMLQAAVRARMAYEKDPVANILVGALHGEQKSAFYRFVTKRAKGRGKTARVAKRWVEKMAEKDQLEPPGSAEPGE